MADASECWGCVARCETKGPCGRHYLCGECAAQPEFAACVPCEAEDAPVEEPYDDAWYARQVDLTEKCEAAHLLVIKEAYASLREDLARMRDQRNEVAVVIKEGVATPSALKDTFFDLTPAHNGITKDNKVMPIRTPLLYACEEVMIDGKALLDNGTTIDAAAYVEVCCSILGVNDVYRSNFFRDLLGSGREDLVEAVFASRPKNTWFTIAPVIYDNCTTYEVYLVLKRHGIKFPSDIAQTYLTNIRCGENVPNFQKMLEDVAKELDGPLASHVEKLDDFDPRMEDELRSIIEEDDEVAFYCFLLFANTQTKMDSTVNIAINKVVEHGAINCLKLLMAHVDRTNPLQMRWVTSAAKYARNVDKPEIAGIIDSCLCAPSSSPAV
jgi:hypothetical protein